MIAFSWGTMGMWGPTRFLKAICRHGLILIPTHALVCAALLGQVGQPFGVPQLFTDEVNPFSVRLDVPLLLRLLSSATFSTQVYAVAFLGLLWTLTILMEQARDAREAGSNAVCGTGTLLATVSLATFLSALLPLASALYALVERTQTGEIERQVLLLPVLGTLTGFILTLIATASALVLSDKCGLRRLECIIVSSTVILIALMYIPVILPAKAIFILLGWLVLAYAAFFLLPSLYRFPALVVLALLAGFSNSRAEKFLFPAMEALYDSRVALTPPDSTRSEARLVGYGRGHTPVMCSASGAAPAEASEDLRLLAPIAGLQAWHVRLAGSRDEGNAITQTTPRKPKLVVIAASGGGYRAAFWTALVLDALAQELAPGRSLGGLDRSIQLMTGASGGMVASAYFVAQRARPNAGAPRAAVADLIEQDIGQAQAQDQRGLPNPVIGRRDSLSSVVRELVKFDMPGFFWPFRRHHDRGRELESHWGTLQTVTFANLSQGEREGWPPHIIFSPLLAETGQPLLISNLDLSALTNGSQEVVEFFKVFPTTHKAFRLSTAARMNATFPYVSPAMQLPTIPARRVVDAAYYDNFGIAVAVAYLEQEDIMTWIKQCTGGVLVIQIRAFNTDELLEQAATPGTGVARFGRFDYITSPFQGAVAARDATMRYRNNRELNLLRRLYGETFLQTVVIEPRSSKLATMTWTLPQKEFLEMQRDLNTAMAGPEIVRLKGLWSH